ncbi:hypothetical protein GCM10009812_10160 [Nocardioides marinus]
MPGRGVEQGDEPVGLAAYVVGLRAQAVGEGADRAGVCGHGCLRDGRSSGEESLPGQRGSNPRSRPVVERAVWDRPVGGQRAEGGQSRPTQEKTS